MNKKFKYTSLVAAGAVTLGLVGGTLAWFTAQDVETNTFSTKGNNYDNQNGSSIEIEEDWIEQNGANITPGTKVNKDVQVKNVDNYNQFIKVNLEVKVQKPVYEKNQDGTYKLDTNGNLIIEDWKTEYKKVVKENGTYYVDGYKEITLQFTNHLTETGELGTWYYKEDTVNVTTGVDGQETTTSKDVSNFYYVGQVEGGSHTNTLLDSVTLLETAGDSYKNIKFDVIVTAEGIQTTNNAAEAEWKLTDTTVKGFYDYAKDNEGNYIVDQYGNKTTLAYGVADPIDALESNGTSENHSHNGAHVKTETVGQQ